MNARQRLSRNVWCDAALRQIAEGGTASVSVEGLARQLGVTKGSGYWHFDDRADLIRSSLQFWADQGTDAVVDELASIEDPRERLRALLHVSFDDDRGAVDARVATSAADPEVATVLARVTDQRVEFLRRIFRDLGLTPRAARHRAALAYAAYVGHVQLAQVDPIAFDSRRVIDEMLATLAPDSPAASTCSATTRA